MTFAVVFTAIGALTVGVLLARRPVSVASSPSPDGATVADFVQHHGEVSLAGRSAIKPADPAVELDLDRGLRSDERTSDELDAVRLEGTWREFVANVSHELKTPVGAVALLAEAVLNAADDPHQVRRFGIKILNEANRLGALVTELIALSRLEGAEQRPELATVDVDTVVQKALDRCRLVAESADIRITVEPPSGLLLNGDATLLVTAVANLLGNAVSYSRPGSPVSVSTRLRDGFVEIAVTDHGLGIALEHQGRVFERFFRIDQALSRSTRGTGLGLAIVKQVATNHGGDVRLWSKLGTGSTFTLRIPVHPDSPQRAPRTPSIPEHVGGSLRPGR